ncbi:unnamed protein product, partial [Staurois parvus]
MGPCTQPPHAAARSRECHGSLYGLPLLLSLSPHSAMCHFHGLLTLLVFPFCHRCCMASHSCCLHRHTVAPHSGFGRVTGQMSEVCGDSKIDGHLICMSYKHDLPDMYYFSSQAGLQGQLKLKVQCSALIL